MSNRQIYNVLFIFCVCANDISFSVSAQSENEYLNNETDVAIASEDIAIGTMEYNINENVTEICTMCACNETSVDCSKMSIADVDDYWIAMTKHGGLTEVLLNNNPLRKLKRIPALPIKSLNLSQCQLEELEDQSFKNILELESLDLSHNNLSTSDINRRVFMGQLQPNFRVFSRLYLLDLSYNYIHSLDGNLFNFMADLKQLYLDGNPLAMIDQVTMEAIASLSKLRTLSLSDCKLESLPEGFLRRHALLEELDLSENKFKTLPNTIGDTLKLRRFDFSKNLLEVIEEGNALNNLIMLEELKLSNMIELREISEYALGGMKRLTELHLSYNPKLSKLSPNSLAWLESEELKRPTLKRLYLNNNNLTKIDAGLLPRWDILNRLDISNNPYVCDCNNQWMVNVIIPLITNLEVTNNNITCAQPPSLIGMSLQVLSERNQVLACDTEMGKITHGDGPEPESIVFLGVVIGVVMTFPVVLIIVVLWKRGVFERFRKGFYEEDNINEGDVDAVEQLRKSA